MRAAVLGSPISHSLSPLLHRAGYAALGLAWQYDAREVVPAELPAFLDGLDDQWAGLSLTMPLKQTVLPLLGSVSALVTVTGAANTVLLRDGQRHGHNTDVAGIVAALREAGLTSARRGVVLGGGATAASALAALSELGCTVAEVRVRSLDRAQPLLAVAEQLGISLELSLLTADGLSAGLLGGDAADREAVAGGEVVINTTPAGALDALLPPARPAPVLGLAAPPVLLDVVYHPWPTPLAALFASRGATVVPGLAMLLHQAAAQVELMTGLPAPLEAMRSALAGR